MNTNINAGIIDMRITGLLNHPEYKTLFESIKEEQKRSFAFLLLCVSTLLEDHVSLMDAADLITDGLQDEGIDALHIGSIEDSEFTITIFQAKYQQKLTGDSQFPENEIIKIISNIDYLFNPSIHVNVNDKLKYKIEEVRSLINDGNILNINIVLCNNGLKWNDKTQSRIDQTDFSDRRVNFIHFNHDSILSILQKTKAIDSDLKLNGKYIVEDFNYRRALIGRVPVSEIAELFNKHGDLLLERNVRRYLGLHSNRINSSIHETLIDSNKKSNFYFYNNGITMICKNFRYNGIQKENNTIKIEGLQIINGGQTCKTIQETLNHQHSISNVDISNFDNVHVLLRLYEIADDDQDFVQEITLTTNSQNPVDLRDLHSNDDIQRKLEIGISDLGYLYKRRREENNHPYSNTTITPAILAESVLTVWRRKPIQAKMQRSEHFGKLYDLIFNELNASQALLAVFIFRAVENKRKQFDSIFNIEQNIKLNIKPNKKTAIKKSPDFLPYSSHYISMLMGDELLKFHQVKLNQINHQNFKMILSYFQENQTILHQNAIDQIKIALKKLYGKQKNSLQQLSATFRRGDLLNHFDHSI